MKLFLISQTQRTGYDTFDAAVVSAENAEDARRIQPGVGFEFHTSAWCDSPELVTVELLSLVSLAPAGVVLASFNAG